MAADLALYESPPKIRLLDFTFLHALVLFGPNPVAVRSFRGVKSTPRLLRGPCSLSDPLLRRRFLSEEAHLLWQKTQWPSLDWMSGCKAVAAQ